MRKSEAEILLAKHLNELGVEYKTEFRFCPTRLWRADFCLTSHLWNGQMILIEVDGGVYTQGRHTRGKGFENDMRKLNKAQALGYYVFRFSSNMVLRGESKVFLQELFRS